MRATKKATRSGWPFSKQKMTSDYFVTFFSTIGSAFESGAGVGSGVRRPATGAGAGAGAAGAATGATTAAGAGVEGWDAVRSSPYRLLSRALALVLAGPTLMSGMDGIQLQADTVARAARERMVRACFITKIL